MTLSGTTKGRNNKKKHGEEEETNTYSSQQRTPEADNSPQSSHCQHQHEPTGLRTQRS